MRFITFKENEELRPACVVGENVVDISRALEYYRSSNASSSLANQFSFSEVNIYFSLSDTQKLFLADAVKYALEDIPKLVKNPRIIFPLGSITLAPPIPRPGKIICAAMNYPAGKNHTRPDYPVIFLKPVSTLSAGNAPVILAEICEKVLYEAELAFYINRPCHNVDLSEAENYIGGYTIANDIGDSILEKRNSQWASGKMFDTFTPVGPALVTPDEIPDPHNLTIQTYHNDRLVQEANTGDLLFDIFEITSYLSTITTLQPGDLILTGSPKLMHGKPIQQDPLRPGDRLKVVIDRLGELENFICKGE